ncbi:MAG: trigger factor [Anaerolineaceae bacterium]|nr:trigger factor [Anaerolineaceae bacterium]
MKIETQLKEKHRINIVAEVEQDLLERHKRIAVRSISKQTKIPGFRPGKAPYSVLLRHFGEEAIIEEALESLVNEIYPKLIDEADIKPYGPGSLDEIISKQPPKFSFTIPLMPEVDLCVYGDVKIDYAFEEASDDEIQQVLMNLQVQQAVTESVEDRAVETGDMVQLTLSETILNPEEDQTAEISKDRTETIYVNADFDHKDVMPYQGFMSELIGLNIDDEKIITHRYSDLEKENDLFEKDVEFSFKVNAISKAEVPEATDEFAQSINTEFETLEELKTSIKEQVETYRKQQYEEGYLTEVLDEIVENSPVKYPEELFDSEVEAYFEQLKQSVSKQGMEFDAYLKVNKQTREEIIEEQRENIETRIHRVLVLEEIARHENITVEPEELQARVAETTMRSGLYSYLSQLPKQKSDAIAQRITMDTANQLLNDKLMKRIVALASGQYEESDDAQEEESELIEKPVKEETSEEITEQEASSEE